MNEKADYNYRTPANEVVVKRVLDQLPEFREERGHIGGANLCRVHGDGRCGGDCFGSVAGHCH